MGVLSLRFLLLILFISFAQCQIIRLYYDDLLDGVDRVDNDESSVLSANVSIASKHTCEHEYGFLPCAENAAGYVFQILIYQGLMMFGEKEMAKGSKVLFQILGASNIVGIIFRILAGLPALLIMIASGVFSSKDDAQTQVSLGVGIYTGMTVFTLTIQWGICLILSKIKWQKKSTSSNPSMAKTIVHCLTDPVGVNIDDKTRHMAGLMLLSLIPYMVVQLVNIFRTSLGSRTVTLIALIVSITMLLLYFLHQVMNPWMQQRSLAYNKTLRTEFLHHLQRHGALIDEDGNLNCKLVRILFAEIDENADHIINKYELQKLILELVKAGEMNIDRKSLASKEIRRLFDCDNNGLISLKEFEDGCRKLILETKEQTENADCTSRTRIHEVIKEKVSNRELTIGIFVKCVLQIMLGIVFMTFLEEPLTSSILHLSHSMNASPFLISFVVVPLAMNARVAIAAISPSTHHHKKKDLASLTFSEIYGGVVMSNITNLTALLAIVYAKDLTWNYSAEVLIVLVVCAVMGIMAYCHSGTYRPWNCLVAFFLYPFSLGLFYVVQHVFHWN